MRGRRVIPAILIAVCMMLCACGSGIPEMTVEQSEKVAEYAAFSLLKYDANNRSRLVSANYDKIISDYEDQLKGIQVAEDKLQPADETLYVESAPGKPVSDTFNPSAEGNDSSEAPQIIDVSGGVPAADDNVIRSDLFFLDLPEGCDINYVRYEVTDSYVGDEYSTGFGLTASAGKKLLVLHFEIANTSGDELLINILDQNLTFKCTVNGNTSRYSLISMLPEDLSTYRELLGDGETAEAVLLFEITTEMLDSVNSLDLSLKNAPKSDTIHLM